MKYSNDISLPEELRREAERYGIDVSKVASMAIERQIRLKKETENLKKGYIEMGEINLGLAELSLEAENEALKETEHYLTECE